MPVDAAALKLVTFPAPVLRQRAHPVPEVNDEVRAVAQKMLEIMEQAEGIGLAAPQVGLSWRLFVVDVPPREPDEPDEDFDADEADDEPHSPRQPRPAAPPDAADAPPEHTDGPVVYINPVLFDPRGAVVPYEEGCLSLPKIRGDVLRPPIISIRATGLDGREFTHTAGGLLARCWQHEMDHLDGVLIIDKMTQMARLKNRSAIRDMERRAS